jgi:hypothetical protein
MIFFNADETGIFFRLTLKFKGQKCVGGEYSKDSITVLVCANADRPEKRKLLVTGSQKTADVLKMSKLYQYATVQTKKHG